MVQVEEEIQKYHTSIAKEVCNTLLHIHDELLFEVRQNNYIDILYIDIIQTTAR